MNIFKTVSERITVDMITDRDVVLGNPNYGKSTYGRLLVELYSNKQWPLAFIEPSEGAVAVRQTRDDVVILGGEYGDYNLDEADKLIPILLEKDLNFITDVSELEDEYMKEVVGDLYDYLFQYHKTTRKVRHYVVDECDYFIPQYHFDKVCKANITRCISKGRKYGMGFTFITQNFTMVDKTILKMVDSTIIFNMSDPIDLKRIKSLVGENLDSKVKHLSQGKCLIYNKKDRNTYTVDKPESPSISSTPKLGQEFKPLKIRPLNAHIVEAIED